MFYWDHRYYLLNTSLQESPSKEEADRQRRLSIRRIYDYLRRPRSHEPLPQSPPLSDGVEDLLGPYGFKYKWYRMPESYCTHVTEHLKGSSLSGHIENRELELLEAEVRIYDFGILGQRTKFALRGSIDPLKAERPISRAVYDSFCRLKEQVDSLCAEGALVRSAKYHFGFPADLPSLSRLSEGDFYLYYAHILTDASDYEKRWADTIKREYSMQEISPGPCVKLWSSWALLLWEFDKVLGGVLAEDCKAEIEKLSSCLLLAAAQEVVLESAIGQYTQVLGAIVHKQANVSSHAVRNLFSHNDYMLHTILNYKVSLPTEEREYTDMAEEIAGKVSEKKERYGEIKEALKVAVEGIEVQSSRRANRYVQFFLACLALLGLQSLFISLVEYLKESGLQWGLGSDRFMAITYLSVALLLLAAWLYTHIRKI